MLLDSYQNNTVPSDDSNWSSDKAYVIIPYTDNQTGIVVRTLQIVGGQSDSIVTLWRTNNANAKIMPIKIDLPAHNYLILWQGFVYLKAGIGLSFSVDTKTSINTYASVINQGTGS